jgi:hypothetical protein
MIKEDKKKTRKWEDIPWAEVTWETLTQKEQTLLFKLNMFGEPLTKYQKEVLVNAPRETTQYSKEIR